MIEYHVSGWFDQMTKSHIEYLLFNSLKRAKLDESKSLNEIYLSEKTIRGNNMKSIRKWENLNFLFDFK
jgi:hypothetical protein